MIPETPATGAADLIASRIPPGHINWLVGWLVVLLLSCCHAVLLSCCVVFLLACCGSVLQCHCVAVLFFSCCLAVLLLCIPLRGTGLEKGGWNNTGLTIIPPSHQLTTPRLPTTPIHPTHHKYQETLKKKEAKMKR